MTMATRTRIARLRTLAVTGLATTGAAAAALTLMPTNAQAAEMPQVHASSVVKASNTTATKAGSGNNLDGWIKQSLAIMKAKGIPGSYDGLKRNIMRESGGNPNAQNNWDVNAKMGTPSKGLLQVISPTFNTYHVSGTPQSITDPVANITAAANYAAHRYGSIDNVNSAY
ncbi:transglycosylase SLT domain-containing protein [Streptomyces sp. NPDC048106]|uniref:transglycosylase SLT domain-containing protein n=1 Tax=Streptomyces sp. NPDC048106 TaxID=3155750 RepID=UPI0034533098